MARDHGDNPDLTQENHCCLRNLKEKLQDREENFKMTDVGLCTNPPVLMAAAASDPDKKRMALNLTFGINSPSLHKLLLDLMMVTVVCAAINAFFVWNYCTKNQLTFKEALARPGAKKVAVAVLLADLLVIAAAMQYAGHLKLAAETYSLSKQRTFETTPVKKSDCPPDPHQCSEEDHMATCPNQDPPG